MDIDQRLNKQLLSQDYKHRDAEGMEKFLSIGEAYALAENAIAVVSNLETCASHVFYGGLGERLGIARNGDHHVLDSIWEEEIFCHILTTTRCGLPFVCMLSCLPCPVATASSIRRAARLFPSPLPLCIISSAAGRRMCYA